MPLSDEQVDAIDVAYLRFIRAVEEGEDNTVSIDSVMSKAERQALPTYAGVRICICTPPEDKKYAMGVALSLDALLRHMPVTGSYKRYVHRQVMGMYGRGIPPRLILWYTVKLLDPFDEYRNSPFDPDAALDFEIAHFDIASQTSDDEVLLERWASEIEAVCAQKALRS